MEEGFNFIHSLRVAQSNRDVWRLLSKDQEDGPGGP